MTNQAADKIRMMRASFRCLVLGVLGLVPFIGLAFALAALWSSYCTRRQEQWFWNPAKPQRVLGLVCASLGALIWSVADTILAYESYNRYLNS